VKVKWTILAVPRQEQNESKKGMKDPSLSRTRIKTNEDIEQSRFLSISSLNEMKITAWSWLFSDKNQNETKMKWMFLGKKTRTRIRPGQSEWPQLFSDKRTEMRKNYLVGEGHEIHSRISTPIRGLHPTKILPP
jgi:hypothetical protein